MNIQPAAVAASDRVDAVTRFFLRCLAQARRNPANPNEFVPYSNAALAVSFQFVALPLAAILSALLISSLKWGPALGPRLMGISPKIVGLVIVLGALVAGHIYFARRYRMYRSDPSASLRFDSERDRQILSRQKTAMFATCGLVIPALTFAVTFLAF
jgi:hypothetical protein